MCWFFPPSRHFVPRPQLHPRLGPFFQFPTSCAKSDDDVPINSLRSASRHLPRARDTANNAKVPAIRTIESAAGTPQVPTSATYALGTGYEVLCYDLRGHGESEKAPGPYSLEMFVSDLRQLTDAINWKRFDLVGFSLGGLIAQSFALHNADRVRTLSIISSVAGRTPEESARAMARAHTLSEVGAQAHLDTSVERWFSDEFRANHPEVVQQRLQRSLENDPHCYAAAYRVLATSDLIGDLHRIKIPTLVMTGEEDGGSTPRWRAEASARFTRLRLSRALMRQHEPDHRQEPDESNHHHCNE
jgi:pimeloyl-ACP methyl ester carboxylesterase